MKNQWKRLTEEVHPEQLNQEQLGEVLRAKTRDFRARLNQRMVSEDDLLPEAYAVVCLAIKNLFTFEETDEKTGEKRRKGIELNDSQIMGGVALHDGRIVEMKTGEGKTLTAALPLYLNALSGKGCILVTTNEYLARRDADELRPLYEMLGLKESCGVPKEGSTFTPAQKREIYRADIVYTTQKALTGDYLQENRRSASEGRFLREMNYCIVDEADAVLLDNASIPHIISGAPRASSRLAETADYLVSMMKKSSPEGEDGDYKVDGESVWLTEKGIRRTEEFFGIGNPRVSGQDDRPTDQAHDNACDRSLYAPGHEEIVKAVTLALRAHAILERDKRYMVRGDHIVLLDEREGRPLPDNMLQSGQHQALEAKEHVSISSQRRSMASITFQSYFNMYPRLAGMTGTGVSDKEEFRSIYGLDVIEIPPDKPVVRKDEPIQIYPHHDAMIQAAMEDILATHRTGQPVLIVVSSIQLSEEMDTLLWEHRIPHSVLNAKNLAKEAKIISEAAQKGTVTVATSVAGRGTDIRLGEITGEKPGKGDIENLRQHIESLSGQVTEVHHKRNLLKKDPAAMARKIQDLKLTSRLIEEDVGNLEEADVRKLGGLAVIGVGMTQNRRSELQARGRSGRKGDVGRSVFYVSLEDDVVAGNSPKWLKDYADTSKPSDESKAIGNAQDRSAGNAEADTPKALKSRVLRRAVMGTRKAAQTKERDLRRQMRSVDDSVRQQREIIYALRNRVLEDEEPEDINAQLRFCLKLADQVIEQHLKEYGRSIGEKDRKRLEQFAIENFSIDAKPISSDMHIRGKEEAAAYLRGEARAAIQTQFVGICRSLEKASRQNIISHREDGKLTTEQWKQMYRDVSRCRTLFLRTMKLKAIDDAWVEQVDYLQQLREIVSGRRLAGRNMQREFSREAHKAYDLMAVEIERATLHNILFGSVTQIGNGKVVFRSP